MPIDFRTRRHANAFSGSRVVALAVAFALHLDLALLISLPMTALPRRHPVPDYRNALLVELYNKPRTTVMPAPIAISLKSDASLQRRQPTSEAPRRIILFTRTGEIIKRNPAAQTIRFPPVISLIPTQAIRLPPGETWAASLPARRFVPGTSRVIVRGFHFEPPGFSTLGGKVRIFVKRSQRLLFCSQVGLYTNLPPVERDRYGLTKHELHLIHGAHYCN